MIELRADQELALNQLKTEGYLYLVANTGWGKSFVAIKAIQELGATIIVAPAHLVKDWEVKLKEHNIEATVFSMQWLSRQDYLKFKLPKADFIIIDEFHRTVSYRSKIFKLLQRNKFDNYLFCSATPFEKGIWEMYAPLRVNHRLSIWKTDVYYTSHTSFQNQYLKMGGFENREIKGIDSEQERFMNSFLFVPDYQEENYLKEIEVKLDVVSDVKQFQKDNFYSNNSNNPFAINNSNTSSKVGFAKQRTLSNGFEYKDGEIVEIFGFDLKLDKLSSILKNHKKTLIFYEYRAEKEELERKGFFIYKNYKSLEEFENNQSCMAVHFRSLGEGVRLKFVDSIVLFTLSTSAKMITQAVGRGKYSGRTDSLTVYRFVVNTESTKTSKNSTPLTTKITKKENNIKKIYKK